MVEGTMDILKTVLIVSMYYNFGKFIHILIVYVKLMHTLFIVCKTLL